MNWQTISTVRWDDHYTVLLYDRDSGKEARGSGKTRREAIKDAKKKLYR